MFSQTPNPFSSARKRKQPHMKKVLDGGIPDWLVYELLLRLPLSSVFAFRLVSKQWLSTSSDPHFIRAYASRASSSSQPYWAILCCERQPDSSSPSNRVMAREIRPRPRLREIPLHGSKPDEGYTVVGASDGLLLYHGSGTSVVDFGCYVFYICNPITGHWIIAATILYGLALSYLRSAWGFLTRVDRDGFVLRSYRIVHAVFSSEPHESDTLIFHVYHSETERWTTFKAPLGVGLGIGPYTSEMQSSGAVLDGVVHWAEPKLGVIVYDPEANPRKVRVVPHPREVERVRSCLCVESRGELRYVAGHRLGPDREGFSIWRLEDGDSWGIIYLHAMESNPMCFRNLFLDPCDSKVVFWVDSGGPCAVYSYNLRSRALEKSEGGGNLRLSRPVNYWRALLLVAPPWPTGVAEKHLDRSPRRVSCWFACSS